MEQCPIKEMEINFQCVVDTENSLFEPVPAKKIKPEWYKKLPTFISGEEGEHIDTIKKCPAMHDWLSMGYLIRNRHTIIVMISERTKDKQPISISLPIKDLKPEEISHIKKLLTNYKFDDIVDYITENKFLVTELSDSIFDLGGHPAMQVKGMSRDDKMQLKFKMDFLIKTPKGTSCYYLDPFLFDNPYFTTWQGIIDTDKFNQITTNNQLIFYPKVNKSFIITKGTPLVQIVPFVRYPWKSKITYLSKEDIDKKFAHDMNNDLKDMNKRKTGKKEEPYYAKRFKTRKEYS